MEDKTKLLDEDKKRTYRSVDREGFDTGTNEERTRTHAGSLSMKCGRCLRTLKVLCATVLMTFCSTGLLLSLGVFYVEFLDLFQQSRAETSLIQSTTFAVFALSGFASGALVRWLGARKSGVIGGMLTSFGFVVSYWGMNVYYFVVSIGIISGCGIGLVFVTAMTYSGLYFKGRGGSLAMSITSMGAGIGGLALPPIIVIIKDEYGLRGTLLIFGGLILNTVAAAGILAPIHANVPTNGNRVVGHRCRIFSKKVFSLLKTPEYLLGPVWVSFGCSVLAVPTMIMVDFVESRGYERQTGISALLLVNLLNAFGRLLPGLSKQVPRISSYHSPLVTSVLAGAAMVAIYYTQSFPILLFCLCLVGLAFGTLISSIYTTAMKLVSSDMFSTAAGLATSFQGIFTTIAGPVAGYTKDQMGSYDLYFLVSGGILLICSCVIFSAYILRIYRNRVACYSQN